MEHQLICADNSIWVRVFVDVDRTLEAEVRAWIGAGTAQIAPALLHYEFTHVLTRYVRNTRISSTIATGLLDALLDLKIDLVDDDELHREALTVSMSNPGLSGYDAQYLAVSERFAAELWTADKRLAHVAHLLGIKTRLWVTGAA